MSDLFTKKNICFILLMMLLAFNISNPINEAEARIWMEKEGYKEVRIVATGKRCNRNKRRFKFLAINRAGNKSTGTLCFGAVRAHTSVNEKAVNSQAEYKRLSALMEN